MVILLRPCMTSPPCPTPPPHNFGRRLREELLHAEEISQITRKILEPVLSNARSCLGVAEGISGPATDQPHRRGTENRGHFERTAMQPSELGDEKGDREVREVRRSGAAPIKKCTICILGTLAPLLHNNTTWPPKYIFFVDRASRCAIE